MVFGRRGPRDEDAARRAEESVRAIEAGGLPLVARERLAHRDAGGAPAATSALSTAEFLLLRRAGVRPLSQVMGSCVFHLGWQYMPGKRAPGAFAAEGQGLPRNPTTSGFEYDSFGRRVYRNAAFGQVFELDTETEAWQEARQRALGRLTEEARLVDADAVVGVTLRRGSYDWGRNAIEFVAAGSAVVWERHERDARRPVIAHLSGQELTTLAASGYWPVGIVAATSVIYVMTGWQQKLGSGWLSPNQELRDYTQGVQHARRVALSRLSRQARALEAVGVVDISIEVERREHEHEGTRSRKQKDMIVTVHTLGTAIVEVARADTPSTAPIAMVLPLSDRLL
jgi:uncharacterized protein YbjQ (UPF0145 family)